MTRLLHRIAPALVLALAGCGSDAPKPPENPPPVSSDHPPPAPENGIQIATPELTLNPGQEIFKCYYTSLPSDAEVGVRTFHSWMTPGSHHFIIYMNQTALAPDGTIEDCSGPGGSASNVPVWAYAAQTPENRLDMPQGVAVPLKAHLPLIFNMHYVNTTSQTLKVRVFQNIEYAPSGYTRAGAFVTFNTGISVPPGGTQTVSGHCQVPAGVKFFTMSTHSHSHTTSAAANRWSNGQVGEVLVKTTDWEHAGVAHWDPSFMTLSAGEEIFYTCSYANTSNQTVTVGQSAITNEMCMAVGYYFPATGTTFCLDSMTYPQ